MTRQLYARETHLTPPRAAAREAIAASALRLGIETDLVAAALASCETRSRLLERSLVDRLLRREQIELSNALVTRDLLAWATLEPTGERAVGALVVRLCDVEVRPFASTPMGQYARDSSLHVEGFAASGGEGTTLGSAIVPLGEGADAERFAATVDACWRAARG